MRIKTVERLVRVRESQKQESVIPSEARNRLRRPLMKQYFVYVMSNKSRRLYTGITSKLVKRVFQHKHKLLSGFTARYNFDMLVYYEEFSQVVNAIAREKEIKGWRREKKLELILSENPNWEDLSLEWQEDPSWKTLPDAERRLKRRPLED